MKYSEKLVQDCREYYMKRGVAISGETAEQFLDTLADLWDCLAKSLKRKSSSQSKS